MLQEEAWAQEPESQARAMLLETFDSTDAFVLDIGCGDGRVAGYYREHAGRVVGIDRRWQTVTTATSRVAGASFVPADATGLPFRDGCFDLAIFAKSL